MKVCLDCGLELPLTAFYQHARTRVGNRLYTRISQPKWSNSFTSSGDTNVLSAEHSRSYV